MHKNTQDAIFKLTRMYEGKINDQMKAVNASMNYMDEADLKFQAIEEKI